MIKKKTLLTHHGSWLMPLLLCLCAAVYRGHYLCTTLRVVCCLYEQCNKVVAYCSSSNTGAVVANHDDWL